LRDTEVPSARQGGGSLPKFKRRMYEEEIMYLAGEIEYLKGITHPRHAYMIRQREKHLAELKEKMK